jgi:hypothetical protein
MKVGKCNGSEQLELEKLKQGGKRAACVAEFRNLLDRELTGAQASTTDRPLNSRMAEESGSILSLNGPGSAGLNDLGPMAIPEVERLGNVMSGLSARLESGQAGLMDIEEALDSLQKESEKLSSLVEGFAPGNPLLQLEQDLSVLSYVESVKWRRGDYV